MVYPIVSSNIYADDSFRYFAAFAKGVKRYGIIGRGKRKTHGNFAVGGRGGTATRGYTTMVLHLHTK